MFGLPTETALLVFGFPLAWIVYTAIFMAVTRDWDQDGGEEDSP